MMNKSLKIVIGILSVVVASLFLTLIEITEVVSFGNAIVEISILGLLLFAITEGIYFLSILIAGLLTKFFLWQNAKDLKDVNKNCRKVRKRKEKIAKLREVATANEN